jgi:hypothetical protein
MIEPIHTPSKPLPTSKLIRIRPTSSAAIVESSGRKSGLLDAFPDEIVLDELEDVDFPTLADKKASSPFVVSPQEFPNVPDATHFGNRNAPDGTSLAHPGLDQYPMNDATIQNSHQVATPSMNAGSGSETPLPPPAPPKLLVLRGLKINSEYPIYEGRNTIGRFADKPVDIDLLSQESIEQIWCSRQHAVITFQSGNVFVEDLNSLNGTWVNGSRVNPGQQRQLKPGDVLQVGTVQMKLMMG